MFKTISTPPNKTYMALETFSKWGELKQSLESYDISIVPIKRKILECLKRQNYSELSSMLERFLNKVRRGDEIETRRRRFSFCCASKSDLDSLDKAFIRFSNTYGSFQSLKIDGNSYYLIDPTSIQKELESFVEKSKHGFSIEGTNIKVKTLVSGSFNDLVAIKSIKTLRKGVYHCDEVTLAKKLLAYEPGITKFGIFPFAVDINEFPFCMTPLLGCDLLYYINNEKVDNTLERVYLKMVLEALPFLHGKGVFHRDIKPENIIVTFNNQDLSQNRLKLIDWEYAVYPHHQVFGLGTKRYIPPELYRSISKVKDSANFMQHDWYSASITFIELVDLSLLELVEAIYKFSQSTLSIKDLPRIIKKIDKFKMECGENKRVSKRMESLVKEFIKNEVKKLYKLLYSSQAKEDHSQEDHSKNRHLFLSECLENSSRVRVTTL